MGTTEKPPAYEATGQVVTDTKDATAPPAIDEVDISAAFAHLNLSGNTSMMDPTPDLCLAHLKLLHVFDRLKRDIQGYDGLFGIFNSRIQHSPSLKVAEAKDEEEGKKAYQKELTDLGEKRWALYIARAVHRYEEWWRALPGDKMSEDERREMKADWHATWRRPIKKQLKANQTNTTITPKSIPPIDVVMVWHTHFLNPRHYLDDCLRFGKLYLWEGFPWDAVNACIDTDLEFRPPAHAAANWTDLTSEPWANEEAPDDIILPCPSCYKSYTHPWTTVGAAEDAEM